MEKQQIVKIKSMIRIMRLMAAAWCRLPTRGPGWPISPRSPCPPKSRGQFTGQIQIFRYRLITCSWFLMNSMKENILFGSRLFYKCFKWIGMLLHYFGLWLYIQNFRHTILEGYNLLNWRDFFYIKVVSKGNITVLFLFK